MERVMAWGAAVVALPEVIDMGNAARTTEELTSAVSQGSPVIADLSATTFCDCAGARAVVQACEYAADSGAELRVVIAAVLVRRVFSLMEADRRLDIYPSVEAARGNADPHRPVSADCAAGGLMTVAARHYRANPDPAPTGVTQS